MKSSKIDDFVKKSWKRKYLYIHLVRNFSLYHNKYLVSKLVEIFKLYLKEPEHLKKSVKNKEKLKYSKKYF
jgi:hypothetical protein